MVLGDISQISTSKIPDFDVLTAGFLCQPFSVAGYRQGFKDEKERGNVFFDIIRIFKEKSLRLFSLKM